MDVGRAAERIIDVVDGMDPIMASRAGVDMAWISVVRRLEVRCER